MKSIIYDQFQLEDKIKLSITYRPKILKEQKTNKKSKNYELKWNVPYMINSIESHNWKQSKFSLNKSLRKTK